MNLAKKLILASSIAALVSSAPSTQAQTTYHWDAGIDGDSLLGGSGVWNLSSPLWDLTGTDAAADNVAWPNLAADIASFGGTAGVVTLGAPVQANRLVFGTAGYELEHGGIPANTLILAGATPTITANADALISAVIAGSAGLSKDGAGVLTLSGANTYGGVTSISAGTLAFSTAANLGSAAAGNSLALSNGATLSFTGATAQSLGTTRALALGAGGGVIDTLGAGALTINGVISGATGFTKTGAGTLILSGTNTYTGVSTLSGGTLQYGADAHLGAAAASLTIENNATLRFSTTAGAATNNHPITIASSGATFEITNTQMYFNVASRLAGDGVLTVKGGSTFVQSGGNLRIATTQPGFTGSVVLNAGGSIEFGVANALNATVPIRINGDGTGSAANSGEFGIVTGITAANPITSDGGILAPTNGTSTSSGPINVLSGGLVVAMRDWHQYNNNRSFNITGPVTGVGGLTVIPGNGNGQTLTLSNAGNTYSGNTSITSAIVLASTATSIGDTGTTITLGGTNGTVALGVALNQAFVDRITTGSTGAVALGNVSSANNLDFSNHATLSLGATGNATYTGTLTPNGTTYRLGGGNGTLTLSNANALAGARDLLVVNGGTIILSNNNSYTGTTTINSGGTLVVGSGGLPGSISSGSLTNNGTFGYNRAENVSLPLNYTGNGTVLQAGVSTINLTAASNTYGRLAFSGSGRIDLGANTVALGVDGGNIMQVTAGSTVGTINATGGGKIQLAVNSADLGAAANSRLIVNAPIANGAGSALDIFNSGTGTVVFSGANTFTGATNIQNGHLVASSLNSVVGGTASSSLGAPATVANGTIGIGSSVASSLIYTGSGETTDRVINLAGTTTGATLDHSGTGTLAFTSNFTATGAGIKSLTLTGSTAGAGLIAGSIVNNSGTNTTALTKNGSGTWTLRGGAAGNTYTGTTSVNGGTLVLDFANATPAANIISSSSVLALGGGTLSVTGKTGATNAQTFASTTLNAGGSAVSITNDPTGNTVLVALGAITRNSGSTVRFSQPANGTLSATNGITTTSANNASGILGGYATVGNDWAAKNATNHPIAYAGYNTTVPAAGGSATTNYLLSGAGTDLTGATAMNSLKIVDTSASQFLSLGTSTLTLSGTGGAGGLMYAGGTTGSYTISGGTLTAGANDLILHVAPSVVPGDAPASALAISSVIGGSGGITKSGNGLLTLSGVNTFTGNIFINGGTIAIAGPGGTSESTALGAAGQRTIALSNGGAFRVASGVFNPNGSTKIFTFGQGGGVLDVASGATLTLDDGTGTGATGAQIQGSGKLTKTGAGTLQLGYSGQTAGGFSNFTGDILVEGGILAAGNGNALGSIALGTTTVASGATLDFWSSAAATYGESITINGTGVSGTGALRISSAVSATLNGPVTLGSDSAIGNSSTGNLLINGSVGGTGSLTKVGAGLLTLAGPNSYTGATTVSAGALKLQRPVSLPAGSALSVAAGAALQVNAGAHGEFQTADMTSLLSETSFAANAGFGIDTSNSTVPVTAPAVSGALAFTKLGTGTLILPASTYTSTTTIANGTLQASADDTLPTTSVVTLGGNGTAGNLDLGAFNQTVSSLSVIANSANTNTITIGAGRTLTVDGTGNSFNIGVFPVADAQTTNAAFAGGGSLAITNPAATVEIGRPTTGENSTGGANVTTVDMTDLASFGANVTTFRVGFGTKNSVSFKLSNTSNSITATTFSVAESNNLNGAAVDVILGAGTNTIAADTINLGSGKGSSSKIAFASQAPGSAGTVTITNKAGTGGANMTIGNKTVATAATPVATLDLRGHVANVTANNLILGQDNTTGTNTSSQTGILQFDAGTFTVNSLQLGNKTSSNTSSVISSLEIGGGSFTVNSGGLFRIGNRSGSAGSVNAAVSITGGTVTSNVNITTGGQANTTSSLTLDGGTLDLTGRSIGATGALITNIDLRSGTLRNVSEINGGADISKTGPGTLILDGSNAYTGETNVNAGTLLVNGSLSGSIVNVVAGVLGGDGVITQAVNLGDGFGTADAILSPGASIGSLETGSVTFGIDAAFHLEINSTSAGTDLLASTGTVQLGLGFAKLNISDLGGSVLGLGERFTFITAAGGITGNFANYEDGTEFVVGSNTFAIEYQPNSVDLVAIPEPATTSTFLAGLVSLFSLRRFRRRSRA